MYGRVDPDTDPCYNKQQYLVLLRPYTHVDFVCGFGDIDTIFVAYKGRPSCIGVNIY